MGQKQMDYSIDLQGVFDYLIRKFLAMNSLVIDLFMCGVAYVILIYFVATMTKNSLKRGNGSNDDGEGGIENLTPPKIDLPPGVIWPTDAPKKSKSPEPAEC